MFKILTAYEPSHSMYLAQMHNLRYKVFFQEKGWRKGLQIHSQMEFDQYDHDDAAYLVRINDNDKVDACARLTPTDQPYLLGHSFPDYIKDIEIPKTEKIYEISRLCAGKTAPRLIIAHLMGCMLEYGLNLGIQKYVSLSDVKIIPSVARFGWLANKLGDDHNTGTDISAALSYDVTNDFYDNVRKIVRLSPEEKFLADNHVPINIDTVFTPVLNHA